MKFTPQDFVGVAGILPTPAAPGADHWSMQDTLNLPETEKMVRLVVDAGIEIVLTTGTFGECATLTDTEVQEFVACVVSIVGRRRPVFAGITTLNTRETIARGRRLMDAGADGLFVGRPMWLALDQAGIVRFYSDLAEAMPDVPLVLYDNPMAFKGKISPEAYMALAKLPQVVASKHTGGPSLEADALAVGENCRILPLPTDWAKIAEAHPDLMRACWSGHVVCAPNMHVALSQAIGARNWSEAARISEKCSWAESAMFVGGDIAKFMDYSIPVGHQRFAAAGLIDPGPPRPPYTDAPEVYLAAGFECGRRWKKLEGELLALNQAA